MVINALKWLVGFLETRFPKQVTPVSHAEFLGRVDTQSAVLQIHDKKLDEIQKQIEILNLRVGLSRPAQMNLQKRV